MLKGALAKRFPTAAPLAKTRVELLASSWPEVDAELEGGLGIGEAVHVQVAPGSGGLALAMAWVRGACEAGVASMVIDATGSTLPHAWVPPSNGARALIYVVVPPTAQDGWLALDLALRTGGFGLVVSLDLPRDPNSAPRIRKLLREREARLLMVGEQAPFDVPKRLNLSLREIRWRPGPLGDVPCERSLGLDVGGGPLVSTTARIHTDRLRPRPFASDRRAPRLGCIEP